MFKLVQVPEAFAHTDGLRGCLPTPEAQGKWRESLGAGTPTCTEMPLAQNKAGRRALGNLLHDAQAVGRG